MIIKDMGSDIYQVMAKEEEKKKCRFKTALKGKRFEPHVHMQINLDPHLSLSSLRNKLTLRIWLSSKLNVHQITKQDTNKLENEVSLSNFSLSHRDKLSNVSPFPSPCKWGCQTTAETCEGRGQAGTGGAPTKLLHEGWGTCMSYGIPNPIFTQ